MKSISNNPARLKVILAIFFIFLFSGYCFAKESPQALLESFPAKVKTFKAETLNVYDDQKLGASLGYSDSVGTTITVYLYDLGAKDIEDGISSQLIRTAKEMAIEDVREVEKSGMYSNVKIIADKDADFGFDTGKSLKMLFVSFSCNLKNPSSPEALPIFSDMYLSGLKGYICKVRVSRPAIQKEEEQEIKETIEILLSALAR